MDRNRKILDEIQRLPRVQVQNVLMAMNDIDLALAMYYLHVKDRAFVLSFVGDSKAANVQLQLDRMKHVRVKDDQVDAAIAALMDRFCGNRRATAGRKYYRPGR